MKRISHMATALFTFMLVMVSAITSGQEVLYLHTDRYRYIAGEDAWLSIYATDASTGTLSGRSSLAYVELLNPWNKPVIQKRFLISGGRGEGGFLLPDTSSSGIYTLRAYTSAMKGSLPYGCFIKELEICNAFSGALFNRKSDSTATTKSPGYIDMKMIPVALIAGDTLGRREKARIRIGAPVDNNGQVEEWDLSISVSIAGTSSPLPSGLLPAGNSGRGAGIPMRTGAQKYEKDGHFLSFRIRTIDGKTPVLPDFLYMSVQGKVAEFRYARPDSTGIYTFILPVGYRVTNLILQPDRVSNDMMLEMEPSFPVIYPVSRMKREAMADSLLDIFSVLSFNYQASGIYGMEFRKPADTRGDATARKRRFYGIPEMEIRLDDYIKLPTMQEVFFELLPGIIFRSVRNSYEMRITNPLTGVFYDEPPLVMIDGVIINDLKIVAGLDPEAVERVEVVKTPYLTGDLILHGIVNIITRSGDFSDVSMPGCALLLPYRVVEKPPAFTAPDYSADSVRQNRKPDLRNTLYWTPSVKSGRGGMAEVEFWSSDLPGSYTVNVFGILGSGRIISQTRSFYVR